MTAAALNLVNGFDLEVKFIAADADDNRHAGISEPCL